MLTFLSLDDDLTSIDDVKAFPDVLHTLSIQVVDTLDGGRQMIDSTDTGKIIRHNCIGVASAWVNNIVICDFAFKVYIKPSF